jgi:hypothetical protein
MATPHPPPPPLDRHSRLAAGGPGSRRRRTNHALPRKTVRRRSPPSSACSSAERGGRLGVSCSCRAPIPCTDLRLCRRAGTWESDCPSEGQSARRRSRTPATALPAPRCLAARRRCCSGSQPRTQHAAAATMQRARRISHGRGQRAERVLSAPLLSCGRRLASWQAIWRGERGCGARAQAQRRTHQKDAHESERRSTTARPAAVLRVAVPLPCCGAAAVRHMPCLRLRERCPQGGRTAGVPPARHGRHARCLDCPSAPVTRAISPVRRAAAPPQPRRHAPTPECCSGRPPRRGVRQAAPAGGRARAGGGCGTAAAAGCCCC